MKKCPECQREYNDERLNFCLDDGAELLFGPASVEPATAVFDVPPSGGKGALGVPTGGRATDEDATRIYGADTEPSVGGSPKASRITPAIRRSFVLTIVAIGAIGLVGFLGYRYFGSSGQINSIAVMPFVNESGNADAEYLSDGMTESLIGSLAELPNLNVKARTSVFRYKGKEIDPRQIGSELNVQAVLTGRVVQRANNIVLYVELIDTATENILWKAEYNRSMTDLVALQNEIARDASQRLRSRLSESDTRNVTRKDTADPEAYRLYLQGRFFWNKRRIGDMGKAIGFFQQAIGLDPNYALAWAGLADAVAQPSDVVPHLERREKALAAAQKALSIKPDLSEAHAAMAHILMRYELDFTRSEQELKRAFELDPKWADIYQRYGEWYLFQGRFEEGLTWFRRGLEIEPFNLPLNTSYGAALMSAGRHDEAILQLRKAIDMDPNHRNAFIALSHAYIAKGMYIEATEARIAALKVAGQDRWAQSIRDGFAKAGWNGVLRAELERYSVMGYSADRLPHYNEAAILCQLGDTEKALTALNRSLEQHEQPALALLKVDVRFASLRNDARFKEFLGKLGLPTD